MRKLVVLFILYHMFFVKTNRTKSSIEYENLRMSLSSLVARRIETNVVSSKDSRKTENFCLT